MGSREGGYIDVADAVLEPCDSVKETEELKERDFYTLKVWWLISRRRGERFAEMEVGGA